MNVNARKSHPISSENHSNPLQADTPVAVSPTITAINCQQCHNDVTAPDYFTPWAKTAHATALQRKIEGSVGQAFQESCLECHTVGYDKTIRLFDLVAHTETNRISTTETNVRSKSVGMFVICYS